MVAAMSLIGTLSGAAAAFLANRLPRNRETIETCAGFLLIGGLALLGAALPVVL